MSEESRVVLVNVEQLAVLVGKLICSNCWYPRFKYSCRIWFQATNTSSLNIFGKRTQLALVSLEKNSSTPLGHVCPLQCSILMTGSGAGHVEDNDKVGGLNEVFLFPHRNAVIKNMLMSQTKKKCHKILYFRIGRGLKCFHSQSLHFSLL